MKKKQVVRTERIEIIEALEYGKRVRKLLRWGITDSTNKAENYVLSSKKDKK